MRLLAFLLLLSPVSVFSEERRSGYEFMSRETRAMQDDDAANPGMFWVLEEFRASPTARRQVASVAVPSGP